MEVGVSGHPRQTSFDVSGRRGELRETEWNISEAASRLDGARSHVYPRISSFGSKRAER
jgi:hypothetical protein